MRSFDTYHEGIVNTADNLDKEDGNYLALLTAFANFAAYRKTPKDHRASVAAAFKRHAEYLEDQEEAGDDFNIDEAIDACNDVVKAMEEQDAKDAADQRAARWTR